jgi:hypothetical protein
MAIPEADLAIIAQEAKAVGLQPVLITNIRAEIGTPPSRVQWNEGLDQYSVGWSVKPRWRRSTDLRRPRLGALQRA